MRSAFLDDAEPEAISHAVRGVLERRGALISEHRHSRVLFHGMKPHKWSWTRAGYVGIYQPVGERAAEVRLAMRARTPWRMLWLVCAVNVLALVLAILTNPSGSVWSVLAILGGIALIVSGVVYIGTLKRVREEERALMDDFDAALDALPGIDVVTAEERELQELEAELEGEIVKRRLDAERASRPAAKKPGSRFSLRPGKKPEAEEDPEARRKRLLARKAELEAKKAAREAKER